MSTFPTFDEAFAALQDTNQRFRTGAVGSFPHAQERESALADCLRAMAKEHGVTLREPVQIDSRGEFMLVSEDPPAIHGRDAFGADFAAALTASRARTGTPGPNVILAQAGWCYLNHFGAEKMVSEYAQRRQERNVPAARER